MDGEHSQADAGVIEPLADLFVTGTPGTIESRSQVRGETMTVELGDDVTVSHPEAVVSIGCQTTSRPSSR
jgi:hypothetical protein